MATLKIPLFLRTLIKRIASNPTVRFLLFIEKEPKHQVMVDISFTLVAFTAVLPPFLAWIGVCVYARFSALGFISYFIGVVVAAAEIPHVIYDR